MLLYRLTTLSTWIFFVGSILCLQEPIWTLLGPTWPLGVLLLLHAAWHRYLYTQDKTLSWQFAPFGLLSNTDKTNKTPFIVNIRFWVLRVAYPICSVSAASVLGLHYAKYYQKSFVYQLLGSPQSRYSPQLIRWEYFQETGYWRELGVQLVWCAEELVYRWAADAQTLVNILTE
jgi:hypothetical protein